MKKFICALAGMALLAACEQKETTVANPPGETKTEKETTIVKESPAEKSETTTNKSVEETTTVTSSPSP